MSLYNIPNTPHKPPFLIIPFLTSRCESALYHSYHLTLMFLFKDFDDLMSVTSSQSGADVDAERLELRDYQLELADIATGGTTTVGKNCLIVAPTGSGKTHVALHIAKVYQGIIYVHLGMKGRVSCFHCVPTVFPPSLCPLYQTNPFIPYCLCSPLLLLPSSSISVSLLPHLSLGYPTGSFLTPPICHFSPLYIFFRSQSLLPFYPLYLLFPYIFFPISALFSSMSSCPFYLFYSLSPLFPFLSLFSCIPYFLHFHTMSFHFSLFPMCLVFFNSSYVAFLPSVVFSIIS